MFIYNTPKNNFTIIPNEVLDNETLSMQALALYVKLRRHSATWSLNVKAFAKKCNLSLNTFYKYLKELYEANLLKRVQCKDEKGRYSKEVAYIFTDSISIEEAEVEIEFLENKKVKELENELKEKLEKDEPESKNSELLNFVKLNNIIDSNNTKESSKPQKFALIDLQNLWKQCKDYLQKEKESKLRKKDIENQELFRFTSLLSECEVKAYENYIAYRSEKKKLSKHTLKRIQSKFLTLKREGQNMQEVVENTILKAWTDLYPIQSKKERERVEKVKNSDKYKSFSERWKGFDYEAELAKIGLRG